MRDEITLFNFALNEPQKRINLLNWKFVCFVKHNIQTEQCYFQEKDEFNRNIMILAEYENKLRLLTFKQNPWLTWEEEVPENPTDTGIQYVYKNNVFIQNGTVTTYLDSKEETHDGDLSPLEKVVLQAAKAAAKDDPEIAAKLQEEGLIQEKTAKSGDYDILTRKYSADKIRCAHLLSRANGNFVERDMIIQYDDCIVRQGITNNHFEVLSQPGQMIKRQIIRGAQEKLFYAEKRGNSQKIYIIEYGTEKEEIIKREVYQLTSGELCALEPDPAYLKPDYSGGERTQDIVQSFYVLDDGQNLSKITSIDCVRFNVDKVIDLSQHQLKHQLANLAFTSWARAAISSRTITFADMTYSFSTDLNVPLNVQTHYFGTPSKKLDRQSNEAFFKKASGEGEDKDQAQNHSDDEDEEDEDKDATQWHGESNQMMDDCGNMISVQQKDYNEFCFFVCPSPGDRLLSLVGKQQLFSVQEIMFISNDSLLIFFKNGKVVTVKTQGAIIE